MLNKNGTRELVYITKIDEIKPIAGRDRVECAVVGGWTVMVRKDELKAGDYAVYFEIDSKLPECAPFEFLAAKHYKIKTQRYKTPDGPFYSQGLVMPFKDFVDASGRVPAWLAEINARIASGEDVTHTFLTEALGVTYADPADNTRKAKSVDKYTKMTQRHPELFKKPWAKWMMRRSWGRKVMFVLFGKKKDKKNSWPVGKFPGVAKTDQERVENMTWVLNDKTPFIVTQKCDGSSGTYILEKKRFGYEFYVCSRNVRMINENQDCFYSTNYYWEVAKKYDIENKMKDWLKKNPKATFVCWQGEICGPNIQKNPQHLSHTHFFCFHWTDSINGRLDIREATKLWKNYQMAVVPIVGTVVFPDTLEELKEAADGTYDSSVCEGNTNCKREGLVYYKTTEPTFSFKNVSREYLMNH